MTARVDLGQSHLRIAEFSRGLAAPGKKFLEILQNIKKYYYRTELEALFFPRGKFFRRCCYESAPHVQFCVARLGNRELLDFSEVFSQLYLTECSFFAENCASQVGDHNFDPAKHQKRSLVAAEAVFLPFYLAERACTAR